MSKHASIIIGVDGASWKVINPLLQENKLPNFKMMMEKGSYGVFKPFDPLLSPRLWTSIATGMAPEKHGIQHFFSPTSDLKAKRLWEIYEDFGKDIGVVGYFKTWPPKVKNNGFMIPEHFAPDNTTIPEKFAFFRQITSKKSEIASLSFKEIMGYSVNALQSGCKLGTLFTGGMNLVGRKLNKSAEVLDYYYKDVNTYQDLLKEIFIYGLKKYQPEIGVIYFHGSDLLGHKYWHFYQSQDFDDVAAADVAKFKNVLPDYYIKTDRDLGEMLKTIEKIYDSYDVAVVSDHGFKSAKSIDSTFGLNVDKILRTLELEEQLRYTMVGQCAILHPHSDDKNEVEQTLKKTEDLLRQIKGKTTNKNLFYVERDSDNIRFYINHRTTTGGWGDKEKKGAPLEDNELKDEFTIDGRVLPTDLLIKPSVVVSGTHDYDGIVFMMGEHIKKGYEIQDMNIYDLCPTFLALNKLPVGNDMDGRVTEELIDPKFLKQNPIQHIDSYGGPDVTEMTDEEKQKMDEHKEILEKQLKALGYM